MAKRTFIALLLFLSLYAGETTVKAESSFPLSESNRYGMSMVSTQMVDHMTEESNEVKIPAKEAHEKPQKGVNIILTIVFIFAALGFVTIGIIIKKSKK